MISKQAIHDLFSLDAGHNAPTFVLFSEQITPRFNYACRFIFEHVLNVKYVVTSDKNEFEGSSFFKINYSRHIVPDSFSVIPSGFIYENGVSNEKPVATKRGNLIYLFANENGDLHYDIFSAVFFMIARVEEWQDFPKDKHERFELKESILFKNKVHQKPVTDLWIMELKAALAKFYQGIIFPKKESRTIVTIDVDNLFAYSNKDFTRRAGASLKDLLKFDFKNIARRNRVNSGKEKDPFDIYEEFSEFCYGHNIPLFFFFLFRTGTTYDRTVDPRSSAFLKVFEVIKRGKAMIGLHPSYESSTNDSIMAREVEEFSQKLNEKVNISRQHYLRFNIRTTPALLISNGIVADFTMGFASGEGFRAGTCFPFHYYDLQNELETELLFVPFCAMDGAYTVYENISADQAFASLNNLKEEARKVHGPFTTVFHERTFAAHLYPGFGEMYRNLLKKP